MTENDTLEKEPGKTTTWVTWAFVLTVVALIFSWIIMALVLIDPSDNNDSVSEEVLQPVPAIAMTPLWDSYGTLEAEGDLSQQELSVIRGQIERMGQGLVDSVSTLEAFGTLTQGDIGTLQVAATSNVSTQEFATLVLDTIDEANQAATATQLAIDCLVEPDHANIRAHQAPFDNTPRAAFVYGGYKYRVLARTRGDINTENMWWLIEIDPFNHVTGWVRSDLVAEQPFENCVNIAVLPVR